MSPDPVEQKVQEVQRVLKVPKVLVSTGTSTFGTFSTLCTLCTMQSQPPSRHFVNSRTFVTRRGGRQPNLLEKRCNSTWNAD